METVTQDCCVAKAEQFNTDQSMGYLYTAVNLQARHSISLCNNTHKIFFKKRDDEILEK